MTLEEALAIVDRIIQPKRLNSVQEMIFRECWRGKTYQEIAQSSNYDTNYLRGVGSRLWQFLSENCQEKVTKNNIQAILRQKKTQNNYRQLHNKVILELPNGSVPINSYFYVERPPVEDDCYYEITQPGAFLQIKAPKNMGKTSLLDRILAVKSSQYYVVKLNLQQVDKEILCNLKKLLRWLGANLCSQLAITNLVDDYWQEDLGVKVSFTAYLQDHILEQLDKPLILALDRLQSVFNYTEIAQEFFPLLRFWHEEAKNSSVWQKLRLIVTQSTENYVPLNFSESPFNVGLSIILPEFTQEQMLDLAKRHQLNNENSLDKDDLQNLRDLIGGHPYLTRLTFYNLVKYDLTLAKLIEEAATETSIYINILRDYLSTLYENASLAKAFKKVILSDRPIQLESIVAYQLESLGLISIQKNDVVPSCRLYRLYFQDRLNQF